MATNKDSRGKLDDSPFSYREGANGKVFISWNGRQVMILKDRKAERFLKRLQGQDETRQQLVMAKETGNFKRGKER